MKPRASEDQELTITRRKAGIPSDVRVKGHRVIDEFRYVE